MIDSRIPKCFMLLFLKVIATNLLFKCVNALLDFDSDKLNQAPFCDLEYSTHGVRNYSKEIMAIFSVLFYIKVACF